MKFFTLALMGSLIIALFFSLSGAANYISVGNADDSASQFAEASTKAFPGMTSKHVATGNDKRTISIDELEIIKPSDVKKHTIIDFFNTTDEDELMIDDFMDEQMNERISYNRTRDAEVQPESPELLYTGENQTEQPMSEEQVITGILNEIINETQIMAETEPITPAENLTPTTEPEPETTEEQPFNNIDISNFGFSNPNITINAGESVIWTNRDSVEHTVTSDSGNELDSTLIEPGQTYMHTFQTPGTYAYHCSIHPSMTGMVTVRPSENVTTTEPTTNETTQPETTEPETTNETTQPETTTNETTTEPETPTQEPTTNETTQPETTEPETTTNETTTEPTTNETTTAANCNTIAERLGGVGIPSGDVCDVVVIRQSPQITGNDGRNLNKFTLMNSVLEFERDGAEYYVMGDFALLETEMNDVLNVVKGNGWTVTGIHNHMILESPKTTFMHWETKGDIDTIIEQANEAFSVTSIKG